MFIPAAPQCLQRPAVPSAETLHAQPPVRRLVLFTAAQRNPPSSAPPVSVAAPTSAPASAAAAARPRRKRLPYHVQPQPHARRSPPRALSRAIPVPRRLTRSADYDMVRAKAEALQVQELLEPRNVVLLEVAGCFWESDWKEVDEGRSVTMEWMRCRAAGSFGEGG
jgi:hypothetical protein